MSFNSLNPINMMSSVVDCGLEKNIRYIYVCVSGISGWIRLNSKSIKNSSNLKHNNKGKKNKKAVIQQT